MHPPPPFCCCGVFPPSFLLRACRCETRLRILFQVEFPLFGIFSWGREGVTCFFPVYCMRHLSGAWCGISGVSPDCLPPPPFHSPLDCTSQLLPPLVRELSIYRCEALDDIVRYHRKGQPETDEFIRIDVRGKAFVYVRENLFDLDKEKQKKRKEKTLDSLGSFWELPATLQTWETGTRLSCILVGGVFYL